MKLEKYVLPSTRIEELHQIAAFLEAAAKLPKTYEIDVRYHGLKSDPRPFLRTHGPFFDDVPDAELWKRIYDVCYVRNVNWYPI